MWLAVRYGDYVRLEGSVSTSPHLLSVSVHPDVDAEGVRDSAAEWLDDHGQSAETASISPLMRSVVGALGPRKDSMRSR